MTTTIRTATPERWQAALDRAFADRLVVAIHQGRYLVPSGSHNGVAYHVAADLGSCDCPAGAGGDPVCKHRALAAYDALALEDANVCPTWEMVDLEAGTIDAMNAAYTALHAVTRDLAARCRAEGRRQRDDLALTKANARLAEIAAARNVANGLSRSGDPVLVRSPLVKCSHCTRGRVRYAANGRWYTDACQVCGGRGWIDPTPHVAATGD